MSASRVERVKTIINRRIAARVNGKVHKILVKAAWVYGL